MAGDVLPDRLAIADLINAYGFIVDDGEPDALSRVFTGDAVFDLTALGGETIDGLAAIRRFFGLGSPPHPAAHHTTNVWIVDGPDAGAARVRSKWISIAADGGALKSGEYLDEVVETPEGWRIELRVVAPRWFPGEPVRLA